LRNGASLIHSADRFDSHELRLLGEVARTIARSASALPRAAFVALSTLVSALFSSPSFLARVLETGDPALNPRISSRAHANFCYQTLYADANHVATGNCFMLTTILS
jgi:hypothetical protein